MPQFAKLSRVTPLTILQEEVVVKRSYLLLAFSIKEIVSSQDLASAVKSLSSETDDLHVKLYR
jgi:hypothetical protein